MSSTAAPETELDKQIKHRTELLVKETKEKFLSAFIATGSLKKAAQMTDIDIQSHYAWKRKDTDYYERFIRAYEQKNDNLLDKAYNVVSESLDNPDEAADMAKFVMKNLGHTTGFNEKQVTENKNVTLNASISSNISEDQATKIAKAFLYENNLRNELDEEQSQADTDQSWCDDQEGEALHLEDADNSEAKTNDTVSPDLEDQK